MAVLMSAGKPRRLGKSWNMSSVKKVFLKRPHLKGTAVFQPCPTTLESLTICRWEQTTYFKIPRPDSPSLGVYSALPTFSLCSATEFSLAWQAQKGQGHGGGGREIAPSLLPLSTHATQVNETLHWCTICGTVYKFIIETKFMPLLIGKIKIYIFINDGEVLVKWLVSHDFFARYISWRQHPL